jgi:hypothetical protein
VPRARLGDEIDRSKSRWLVKWSERDELAQRLGHFGVDAYRRGEDSAAVHHPVADHVGLARVGEGARELTGRDVALRGLEIGARHDRAFLDEPDLHARRASVDDEDSHR